MTAAADRRREAALWFAATLVFAATEPVWALWLRGWNAIEPDLGAVRSFRTLWWAALYALMAAVAAWRARALAGAMAALAAAPFALAWLALSALWSPAPAEAAAAFAQFALILACGLALGAALGSDGAAGALFRAGLLAAAASWAMAAAAPFYGFGQEVNPGALRGVYPEKNHLAMICSIGFAAGLFAPARRPWRNAGLALLAATLAAAQSSIALCAMALALFLRFGPPLLRPAPGAAWILLALGGAALAALGALLPLALDWLGETPTLNGRTTLWAALWPHAAERPLLGHGFEAFWRHGAGADMAGEMGWRARGAHNGWLQAILSAGLIGAALWAALWLEAMTRLRAAGAAARGAFVAGAVILLWSLFETNQIGRMNAHPLIGGMILGASVAATRAASAMRAARQRKSGAPSR